MLLLFFKKNAVWSHLTSLYSQSGVLALVGDLEGKLFSIVVVHDCAFHL